MAVDHPILAMRDALKACSADVSRTETFCENAKPNMDVAPGMKTPFKVDLCNKACDSMRLLISDANLLLVASQSGLNTWRAKGETNVYAEESVTGKIVAKLQPGAQERFRQRGPFLIRSEALFDDNKPLGFVSVEDMELISHSKGVISRPVLMDLQRIKRSHTDFVGDMMEHSTELLIQTLEKEDESPLESPYLNELNKRNVYALDSDKDTKEMLSDIFQEVNQFGGGAAGGTGEIKRLLTDDRAIRGCVMAVAINNLRNHFADLDSASIEANIH